MRVLRNSLRGWSAIAVVGLASASCSSGNTSSGNGYGGGTTTGTLVSTCDQICTNVVAQCGAASNLYGTCLSACGDLNLVNLGCLDPFASYLTCIAGATQVQCGADGQYVLITPGQCEADRQSTLTCNAEPGLIAACIAVPGNDSCGATTTGTGLGGTVTAAGRAEFCVGAPEGCTAPSPNPLGIGIYCCP